MDLPFVIIAVLTLGSAIAAMALRNLVHCVLCLIMAFGGVALVYLRLGAQFLGFAQVLVYIGAVAILILFTLLFTRGGQPVQGGTSLQGSWVGGLTVGAVLFVVLTWVLLHTQLPTPPPHSESIPTIQALGTSLLDTYLLPLEALGLLLTIALMGGALIALPHRTEASQPKDAP